jgi:hypothetical protein
MSIAAPFRTRLIQVPPAPPAGGAGPAAHNIGVLLEGQEKDNWCWAAVSVSIRNFQQPASPPLRQCELANIQLQQTDCCMSGQCDKTSQLEVALANAGVAADNQQGVLTFADVQQGLILDKPVCCAIQWQSGDFHFVQIDGFIENGPGGDEVVIQDPKFNGETITYQALLNNYHGVGGRWVWSYLVL